MWIFLRINVIFCTKTSMIPGKRKVVVVVVVVVAVAVAVAVAVVVVDRRYVDALARKRQSG